MIPMGPAPVISTSSPKHGKRERGVDGVAERIEDGGDVQIDVFLVTPQVGHRHRDVIGERARPVHADALDVRAQMPPSGQAVAAAAADHVTFAAHEIARVKIVDVGADFHDLADELMADRHRHGNGALRPFVPVVDVNIGAADAGAPYPDQNVVDADGGFGNLFEPQARLALALYECFHEGLSRTVLSPASRFLIATRSAASLQGRHPIAGRGWKYLSHC